MATWTRVAMVEVEPMRSGGLWGCMQKYSHCDSPHIGGDHVRERPEEALMACTMGRCTAFHLVRVDDSQNGF